MLVACDPGTKHCAFAIYDHKKLISYKKITPTLPAIKKFFSQFKDFDFVIEDQYLNLNVKTLMKLVTVRTMVTTIAQLQGAKNYTVINPQKWQRTILGVNIKAKREQRKRVSCIVASSVAKKEIKDHDIADAICIGEYILRGKMYE